MTELMDSILAMPSARAATPSGLSRFASSCQHRIAIADPERNEWVLAFWPHMFRPGQRPTKARLLHGGWYPSVLRPAGYWVAQFSRTQRMRVFAIPELWTHILPPLGGERERLETLAARYTLPTQRGARNRVLRQLADMGAAK